MATGPNTQGRQGAGGRDGAQGRQERRKARTRAALLASGRRLFAEQGFEATAVAEITDAADLGVGSFYNHFASKDDLLSALLEQTYTEQLAALDSRRAKVSDPAEAVSIAHRHWVRLASEGPEWAWLMVRLEESFRLVIATQKDSASKDLMRGIECGRFAVAGPELALLASGGALISVMRAVLTGYDGDEPDSVHAEGVLRAFGIAPGEAAAIARRPLPEVTHPIVEGQHTQAAS